MSRSALRLLLYRIVPNSPRTRITIQRASALNHIIVRPDRPDQKFHARLFPPPSDSRLDSSPEQCFNRRAFSSSFEYSREMYTIYGVRSSVPRRFCHLPALWWLSFSEVGYGCAVNSTANIIRGRAIFLKQADKKQQRAR